MLMYEVVQKKKGCPCGKKITGSHQRLGFIHLYLLLYLYTLILSWCISGVEVNVLASVLWRVLGGKPTTTVIPDNGHSPNAC